ncbi:MAG: nitrogenase cofactor biosynthesis protein NifB [Rhodospirillaceae bacterium]
MAHEIIPLETVARRLPAPANSPGCKSASGCGANAGPADLPPGVWDKVKDHPCYSEQAHHYFARMHVAVAPACNIQCNYCNRKYDCVNESRPGVTSERLTPEQALRKVEAVAARMPQLSVLGIAGPGDALADAGRTFETFELVRRRLPDLKLCLSTNGLALPDHVERIRDLAIDHVTITINMLDPAVGEDIYAWVFYDHARRTGREASRILSERQIEGLRKLVEAGVLVKVNSVLIPGLNDRHLLEVNERVRRHGAFLHNVMPLLSDPAHGTVFGLAGRRGPSAAELKGLQDRLGGGARLMKHCRQCRADAVGLLGQDQGSAFTLDQIGEAPAAAAEGEAARQDYRAHVERERADRERAAAQAARALGAVAGAAGEPLLVAVCSKGGGRINQHFGHAGEFQIYEVDRDGIRFVGHRRADHYCQGGYGEDDKLEAVIKALDGVPVVLAAKIGACPRERLEAAGISAVTDYAYDYIETGVGGVFRRQGTAAAAAQVS